jgi:hypothetical protein
VRRTISLGNSEKKKEEKKRKKKEREAQTLPSEKDNLLRFWLKKITRWNFR